MPARDSSLARSALRLANRITQPLDRLAASSGAGSSSPIMIVGLPRSGTTLMYELFVQAFEVSYLTRIYSYLYGLPNITTRAISAGTRDPSARYTSNYGRISGKFAPAENAVFWNRWFPEHPVRGHFVPTEAIQDRDSMDAVSTLTSMSAIAGRPFVFKNVYMTLSLPAFFRLVPNARVIIVTREIREIIASVYNKRRSISSWWTIRPPFSTDVDDKEILVQTGFQCVRSQQLVEHSMTALPSDRTMIVDYGSICADPHSVIAEIARWVGSDFARRQNNEIPGSFQRSAGPGLPDKNSELLSRIIADLDATKSEYISRVESLASEQTRNVAN